MPAQQGPLLVVVSGPSGSGKSTICRRLVEKNGYTLSVSATTRSPRPGEQDGRDYRFVSRSEFLDGVARGEFMESSEHFGNLYGTPRGPVEQALAAGKVVVLEIDVNGARQVRRHAAGAMKVLSVFVNAPSFDELRRRIMQRPGTQDEAVARERLARARTELAERGAFDAEVVNDVMDDAVARVEELIGTEAAENG